MIKWAEQKQTGLSHQFKSAADPPYSVQRRIPGNWWADLHFHPAAWTSGQPGYLSGFHRPRGRGGRTCPWTARSQCDTAPGKAGWGRAAPWRCCFLPSSSWSGVLPEHKVNTTRLSAPLGTIHCSPWLKNLQTTLWHAFLKQCKITDAFHFIQPFYFWKRFLL